MGLTFEEKAPETATVEKIILDGVEIGKMETKPPTEYCKTTRYFATINVKEIIGVWGAMYGHGDTREAAVEAAISDATETAHKLLAAVSDLQRRL